MAENATKTKNNPLANQTPEDIVRNRAQVRSFVATLRLFVVTSKSLLLRNGDCLKKMKTTTIQMLHCSTLWSAFHGLKTKMAS